MLRRAINVVRRRLKRPQLERGVPPREINHNQLYMRDHAAYVREFKQAACLRLLPFLMRNGLTPSSSLLDYGCGPGSLAFAASKFLSDDGHYYGYEPIQKNVAFLRDAYSDRTNFHFGGDELRLDEDYVGIQQGDRRRGGVAAQEVDLAKFVDRPIDVQWTHSVFSHMWADPIVHMLKEFTKVTKPGNPCINTWLIIDDFAAYALRCGEGVADCQMPHKSTAYGPIVSRTRCFAPRMNSTT